MKIIVYTITNCEFSKKEKEYLTSHSLQYEEKNLETNREFLTEMLAVSNNFAGTPVTKIEKDDGKIEVLKGFTQDEFDKVLGFSTQPATAPAVQTPAVQNPVPQPQQTQQPQPSPAPIIPAPPVTQPVPTAVVEPTPPPVVEPIPVVAQPAPQPPIIENPVPSPMPVAPLAPEPAPIAVAPAPMEPLAPPVVNEPSIPSPVPSPAPVQPPVAAAQSTIDPLSSILSDLEDKAAPPQASQPTPAPANLPNIPDFSDKI